jgi:hypothetical protein
MLSVLAEHADVKDILTALGLPDSTKPNVGHVRQTVSQALHPLLS